MSSQQVPSYGYWSFAVRPYELVTITPGSPFRVTHACFGQHIVDPKARQKLYMAYKPAGSPSRRVCIGTLIASSIEHPLLDYIMEAGSQYTFESAASQILQVHGCFPRQHHEKPILTEVKRSSSHGQLSTDVTSNPAGSKGSNKTHSSKKGTTSKSVKKGKKHDMSTEEEEGTEEDVEEEDHN